jgi:large subunit ribosomal protein L21
MYAVIETGGKQYRVEVGTELQVELLDAEAGDAVQLERVLLVADGDTAAIGRPLVANASVAAEVVRLERGEKLISFKYRPKARRRVKKGHRQELMVLRISDIVLDGKSAAGEAAQVESARRSERQRLEAAARKQGEADAALAAKLAAEKPVKAPARGRGGSAATFEAEAETATEKTTAKAAPKRDAKTADAGTSKATPTAAGKTASKPATKSATTRGAKASTGDTKASDTKASKAKPADKSTGGTRARAKKDK